MHWFTTVYLESNCEFTFYKLKARHFLRIRKASIISSSTAWSLVFDLTYSISLPLRHWWPDFFRGHVTKMQSICEKVKFFFCLVGCCCWTPCLLERPKQRAPPTRKGTAAAAATGRKPWINKRLFWLSAPIQGSKTFSHRHDYLDVWQRWTIHDTNLYGLQNMQEMKAGY